MRISLVDREQNKRTRRKARSRRGRRRSRTFHSAIPQVQGPARSRVRTGKERRPRAKDDRPPGEGAVRRPLWQGIRWRSVLRRLPALAILLALLGLIAYTSVDARFFVYEARVVGSHYVPAERIYALAGVHEQNIFWLQPRKAAERIEQLPGIRSARVRCSLPARVSITVDERRPVIMWRTERHGGDWWLDEEGLVLPYHGDTESEETIFVVDTSDRQLQEGATIQPRELVQWVRQLAVALPGSRIFFYQADRGLSFTREVAGHKWQVYVGDGDGLVHKIQVVRALTDYLVARNSYPAYMDVRWPDLPVYGLPATADAGGGQ